MLTDMPGKRRKFLNDIAYLQLFFSFCFFSLSFKNS